MITTCYSVTDTLVPYKFEFTTRDSDVSEINNLILTAQDLATSYSTYRNRVDLTSVYRRSTGLTCLDKVTLKNAVEQLFLPCMSFLAFYIQDTAIELYFIPLDVALVNNDDNMSPIESLSYTYMS